ncbi:dynein light chain Tctex-type protein 2B-like isoform X2 [Teleopsis dalmanni]|uniref:dynein light chain Tctex-type protein 2B-like isoform X2 n=2 Tax=Teleopsis dalmanni TaxID=139649 RepID=UPI0018CFCDEB|nr:dynein light chain Tctex-type protein 2B-like isoform X2 [Teleopsis dalmanni]
MANDGDDVSIAPRRKSNVPLTISPVKPVMKFMPTYRLESIKPLNREICEKIIKSVCDTAFATFTYSPKIALRVATEVSEEIKNRIKSHNFDRYRLICVVTIGEKCFQGYFSLLSFLWDSGKDGYISYVYDVPDFFVVITLFYLYYD